MQNPEEVRLGTAKPKVSELGPFSYREVREKQNIVQIQETISYGSYIAYEFDREASCDQCEFNTNVTVINPVIVMIDWALENVRIIFILKLIHTLKYHCRPICTFSRLLLILKALQLVEFISKSLE